MLKVSNLSKTYNGNFKALEDISFEINDGEIVGFIGPNGAGKTTTIKSIMGLITFDAGKISFDGKNIKDHPVEVKSQLAYIPDNPELYDNLTGVKFLNFIADIYNIPTDSRNRDIAKYSNLLKITNNLGDLISSYSHGMKQKLSIISALIRHPKLLILDEPFVGLDPIATYDVKLLMREMCDEGNSVFFSTHVLEVVEKLCDRVMIIEKGEIVASGTVEDIKGDKSLEDVFLEISNKNESE